MFEDKIDLIPKEEITRLKEDLEHLYARELFAKMTYDAQIQKFDGIILETLKELLAQEEEHAYILNSILEKVDDKQEETISKMLPSEVNASLESGLAYDVTEEEQATIEYKKILEKVVSPELKEVLEHILQEEFAHVGRLQKYLE